MSQENVEVFKRAFDAINRRDAEGLLSELDPEVEWHSAILIAMGGEQTVYRGHEGVREWLRDLYETLSEFHAEYPEIRDLGDRAVAIGSVRARGTGSEAEIESLTARWSSSRTAREFGFEPTSTPKRPWKPPRCRSSHRHIPAKPLIGAFPGRGQGEAGRALFVQRWVVSPTPASLPILTASPPASAPCGTR